MQLLYYFLGLIMDTCLSSVSNYGIAIILFTIVTKILILPLTIWTYFNSIKMVQIQPEYNEIKARLFGRQDEMAEEHANLFKREHYHPLVSSFPLVAQLVLLIGVVGVIRAGMANPSINMRLGEIDLGNVPSEVGLRLLWSPVIAGFSSWILCVTQNRSNILQAEQSDWNRYGTMVFSVALSLYLGWFVPVGVALYWICSNLLSIVQLYAMNWIIKPQRFVDYERLVASRNQLHELEIEGNKNKKNYFSAERRKERTDYKRFFSVTNKHIVFYSESNGFYKYYKGFVEWLLLNTKLTIHYISSDYDDNIFNVEKSEPRIRAYYIGDIKLISLMLKMDADVVVLTMPDLDRYHIKRSIIRKDIEYIFINHAFGSTNLTLRKGATDRFDTIFLVGPHQREEEEKLGILHNVEGRKLVDVGYPLIDELRFKYQMIDQTLGNEKKLVLIAPSWQKDNIIDSCLEELIDLIDKDRYRIIVRPHPQEVRQKKEHMENLRSKYSSQGIEFQLDFSSNNPIMDADLLITDWSDICWEYAFASLRPVLFIETPMKIMNPDYKEIDTIPINILLRDKIGKRLELEGMAAVGTIIDEMIASKNDYNVSIEELAHAWVYNLDNSSAVGGRYLLESVKRQIARKNEVG